MRNIMAVAVLLFWGWTVDGAQPAGAQEQVFLTLEAQLTEHARYGVFTQSEPVRVQARVFGRRLVEDAIVWQAHDYTGAVRAQGKIPVAQGSQPFESVIEPGNLGAGNFELWMSLEKAGVTLPRRGSQAGGFVAYGVLPTVTALPLARSELSRFGGQGTNFLETGEFLKGDYLNPLYPLVGMHWVYFNRRLAELAGKGPDSFTPRLEVAQISQGFKPEQRGAMAMLYDLHGVPGWLLKLPDGMDAANMRGALTEWGQRYAPKDWDAYGALIGKVAREQALVRKTLFPAQQHNYYQIHWEPDWHWRGTDAEFIKMYEVARRAIRANDPDGLLLGPNYGVLKTGNDHLERLLPLGLAKHLDGMLIHTYYLKCDPDLSPESGGIIDEMRRLVRLTRQYLPANALIINTEWGTYFAGRTRDKFPDLLRWEAANFLRGHLITLGEGVDTTFFFYTADIGRDEGGGLFYNLTTPHPGCGATHIAPKPVGMGAAAMTRLLEGTKSLGPLECLGDDVYAYVFDRAGERLVALWLRAGEPRTVRVPVGLPKVRVYDVMGNVRTVKTKDGVAELTASTLPLYCTAAAESLPASGDLSQTITVYPGAALQLPPALRQKIITPDAMLSLWRADAELPLAQGLQVARSARAGGWLLRASSAPDKPSVCAGRVEVLPPVSLRQLPGTKEEVTLELKNHLAQVVTGTISLRAGNKELARREATVAAQTTSSAVFAAKDLDLSQTGAALLQAYWRDSAGVETRLALSPLRPRWAITRVNAAPVADGNLTDWPLERFLSVGGEDAVIIGKNEWQGADDLCFRIGGLYDDQYLYLALKVRDQEQLQTQPHESAWKNDSVQIGFSAAGDDSGKTMQKLCFAIDPRAPQRLIGWRTDGTALPRGNLAGSGCQFFIKRLAGQTDYEIALPWSFFGGKPANGMRIGVLVNDTDTVEGRESKRKAMEAFGGMSWSNAADFGELILQ